MGNAFCRINRTSSAHSQDKVCPKRGSRFYARFRKREERVWLNSAPFLEHDPCVFKFYFDPVQQSASFYTASPIDKKHPASAPLFNFLCCFLLCVFSEYHLCRCVINKFLHIISLLFHQLQIFSSITDGYQPVLQPLRTLAFTGKNSCRMALSMRFLSGCRIITLFCHFRTAYG